MNTRLVSQAADVISRAMENGRQTPTAWAIALESAQLLQSPESAARLIRAEQRRAELEAVLTTHRQDDVATIGMLRARVAELEQQLAAKDHPVDEAFVPRTERSYWVAIADALNAAVAVGMPVGIDLDGTLTDHKAWSVVWDQDAERWALSGYEGDACSECGTPSQQWCKGCAKCACVDQHDAGCPEGGDAR
ncbi:hypothetical protein [Streptomyces sp. NPDC003299]